MSGIGNVGGGNQPINNDRQIQQNGLKRNDVQTNLRSIFDQYDTNGDKVLNEQDGAGAVKKFWNAAKTFLDNLKGAGKTEQKGTAADVQGATNASQNEDKTRTTFAPNGNVIPEIVENPDGSKDITHNGEKMKVKDDSITVTDANGKNAGGIKQLSNGMQVLTQADGKQGVFDPKKGEFLLDNEAQKILAQFS